MYPKDICTEKEMSEILNRSDLWIIFHLDKEGIHLRTPSIPGGLAMIANYLGNDDELWDIFKKTVWETKKRNKKNSN